MTSRLSSNFAMVASAIGYIGYYYLSLPVLGSSPARARRLLQRWSGSACQHLGVEVALRGERPEAACVYLSNHRSYLDIPVLSCLLGAPFLSRADVRRWPVVGFVAQRTGTVFVDRDDPRSRVSAARALLRGIGCGGVVIFPEGTTCGERLPHPFPSGLFRLLRHIDLPVVPITIRYSDRRAYWIEDVTVREHVRGNIQSGPPMRATVHIGAPLPRAVRD